MNAFNAFSRKGTWYRGNCHTHTTLSDGSHNAQDTAQRYRDAGYDFLVLTDHVKTQTSVSELQGKGFLVINGIELHPPSDDSRLGPYHIVGIGVDKTPREKTIQSGTAASVIRWIKRHGGIPVYAHPYWCGHDITHMELGRTAFGVEIYNATCALRWGLGDSSAHLDQALHRGYRWTVFATDDSHLLEKESCLAWIMVKATALTREGILDAIRKKQFYASTGPRIKSLSVKNDEAYITCSPVNEIIWRTEGARGTRVVAENTPLTRGRFDLTQRRKLTRCFRVEIIAADGGRAWSNPLWWNDKTRTWSC